jgi:uncharacterized protein YacL
MTNYTPQPVLLDTSLLIDGRIAAVARTGFLNWTLLIPWVVIQYLEGIAAAADIQHRVGQNGLDTAYALRLMHGLTCEIIDENPYRLTNDDLRQPDANQIVVERLLTLGESLLVPIMTADHNIRRQAEARGLTVLDINDLAAACRMPVPSEDD